MSIDASERPVTTGAMLEGPHVHTRSCWWDVIECRWSGPAHPPPRLTSPTGAVPAPRAAPEV